MHGLVSLRLRKDGETSVSIGESVREEDVYIIQTGFNPAPSTEVEKNGDKEVDGYPPNSDPNE